MVVFLGKESLVLLPFSFKNHSLLPAFMFPFAYTSFSFSCFPMSRFYYTHFYEFNYVFGEGAYVCRCLRRPEECVGSLELEFEAV